jgi:hypothetical protein
MADEAKKTAVASAWAKRLAAKEAELAAAKAEITADDQEEIDGRAREADLDAQIREARRKTRTLRLDRAVESIREKLSVGGKRVYIDGLQIDGRDDAFVIVANKAAQEALTARINHPRTKPGDLVKIYLDYALLVTKAWISGDRQIDTSVSTESGSVELKKFLEESPGVVASIAKEASRLAGAHAEDHKS